jgi:transaldolase
MAASFRSTGEVEALAGCDRMTIAPPLLKALSEDEGPLTRRLSPDTLKSKPDKIVMDEKAFRWAMNENAMATEKLAEGIRTFAKDLKELRRLVGERLA